MQSTPLRTTSVLILCVTACVVSSSPTEASSGSQYASFSTRHTDHTNVSLLFDDSGSLWRNIRVTPSLFNTIEYGYNFSDDFGFSASLSVPENTEDLFRTLFLGIQAGGWSFRFESGYLRGITTNPKERYEQQLDSSVNDDLIVIPVNQEFENLYMAFSALKMFRNGAFGGPAYIYQRSPMTLELARYIDGQEKRTIPEYSFAPANQLHILGYLFQLSPTKFLIVNDEVTWGCWNLHQGEHYQTALTFNLEFMLGLVGLLRDSSNDDFIIEQVLASQDGNLAMPNPDVIDGGFMINPGFVTTWSLEWLHILNFDSAKIFVSVGVETRTHQYLPLFSEGPDAEENDGHIVADFGIDSSGQILFGPFARIGGSF